MTNLEWWLIVYGLSLTLLNVWLSVIALKVISIENLLRLKILGRDI